MRRPGFEPGLPDWQSDVLDQTGRSSPIRLQLCWLFSLFYLESNCVHTIYYAYIELSNCKGVFGLLLNEVREFIVIIPYCNPLSLD
jgi:hypothetical protein